MRYYENECISCSLPCKYEACPYYRVEYFVCDFCKEENVKLYHYNGYEACGDCILKEFDVVEDSELF